MLLLDYLTGPARTVEPPSAVDNYVYKYEFVDWLDTARFTAVEECPYNWRDVLILFIFVRLRWFAGVTGLQLFVCFQLRLSHIFGGL